MNSNPQLVDKYNAFIQNQLQLGIIEKVTSNEKDTTRQYIPHHVPHHVINQDKVSTNVKVVYDTLAKINKGRKSLYECLYPGPTMLKYFTGVLLRFRPNTIAIAADIY